MLRALGRDDRSRRSFAWRWAARARAADGSGGEYVVVHVSLSCFGMRVVMARWWQPHAHTVMMGICGVDVDVRFGVGDLWRIGRGLGCMYTLAHFCRINYIWILGTDLICLYKSQLQIVKHRVFNANILS